jgi:hypothetical protein
MTHPQHAGRALVDLTGAAGQLMGVAGSLTGAMDYEPS